MISDRKRNKILDAAEKIMSEKGLTESNISEIAESAGVKDSTIYRYFKSKEDLLFSIPGRRMEDVLNNLSEQLQGIRDPISKLSKMIWFHLHFNDTYRGYARLLLLECRSNINFYQHQSYALIRKYAGILLGILNEGVRQKVFRSDVNIKLVRDIIFGLLDWETLSCLAAHEVKETVSDLDDILGMILPMITIQPKGKNSEMDKPKRILRAAEKMFAQKGYYQATISEIARLSNVSEGTIYEYFQNKEDVLLSIAKQRFIEHKAALEEVFEIKTPLRKLRRLIRYHFFLYLTERDFLKVFLLLIQLNSRFYESQVYKDFQDCTEIITYTLEEGKKTGSIRSSINSRVFRNFFLGAFSHMALRWLLLEKEETDKTKEIDEVVSLFCRAVDSDSASEI